MHGSCAWGPSLLNKRYYANIVDVRFSSFLGKCKKESKSSSCTFWNTLSGMHETCVNKVLRCRIRDAYANAVEELKAVYMSDFPGSWLIVIESLVNKEIIIPIKGIERKVQIHTWNAMQAYNIIMLIDYMFKVTTPEGMVRTFPHEEPRSFENLGSKFSVLGC